MKHAHLLAYFPICALVVFAVDINAAESLTMKDAICATYKVANDDSTATACVVRTRDAADGRSAHYMLVSAAHTFERMKGDVCTLVLRTEKADGTYSRREITINIRKDDSKLWVRHKDVDIAVLDYIPPTGFENFAIPLEALATDEDFKQRVAAGAYVRLLCYPAQFEANGAGFPILRHGVVASFPLAPAHLQRTFLIDFTTFAGDSGGPVFSELEGAPGGHGNLKLIGVVTSQQWSDEKIRVSDREDRIVRHPFGLGTAVNSHLLRELIVTAGKR